MSGFGIPTPGGGDDDPDEGGGSGSGFPLTADADFGGFKGVNLAAPVDPQDAATLQTVIDQLDASSVLLTGPQTVAGVKTFSSAPVVPADVYDSSWNGLQEPAPKDALWDALGAISAFAKTVLDDADAAAVLTTLGVSGFVQTILDDANAAAVVTTLGLAALFAPKDMTGVLAVSGTTLTNTSPNNTSTYQQHGTEEVVFAQADCPTAAAVVATYVANMVPGPGSPAVGDRGSAKLQIAFDGSTFVDMTGPAILGVLFSTTANRGHAVAICASATGTVTGDIQVRAMVKDTDQANDTTWTNGGLTATVVPQ